MEGVEEREATDAFSPPGLEIEGTLSAALTPARPRGDTPAAVAVLLAETGLG